MTILSTDEPIIILPCRLVHGPVVDMVLQSVSGASRLWVSHLGIGVDSSNFRTLQKIMTMAADVSVFAAVGGVFGFSTVALQDVSSETNFAIATTVAKYLAIGVLAGLLWALRKWFAPTFENGPQLFPWDSFDRIDVVESSLGHVHIFAKMIRTSREVTRIGVIAHLGSEQASAALNGIPVWAGSRFRAIEPRPSRLLQMIPGFARRLGAAIREAKRPDEPTD